MNQEILKEAIKLMKPIEFEYNKMDKIRGKRIGNTHCIFIHLGSSRIDVDIFQTDGVSDSNLKIGLPWRRFTVEFMENIKIMHYMPSFEVAEGYNPNSPLYINSIAKI